MVTSGWRRAGRVEPRGPGVSREVNGRVVRKRSRARNAGLVRRFPVQEGGPALPLGVLDLQILPDREHTGLLQPPRGSLSPRQGAGHGLRHASPTTTRSTAAWPCSNRRPDLDGLLHLRGGRDLVSRHPAADPRQRLRHRRDASTPRSRCGAATSTTCTSTSAPRTSSPRPTTCSRTTGCATPRGATSRRCSGCSTSSRSRTAR